MMSSPLRLLFAGTPEFAVPSLDALLRAGYPLTAVYTQPDRPAGRGRQPRPSPVKQRALAAALPIHQPLTLRDAAVQAELAALAELQSDGLLAVSASGIRVLPPGRLLIRNICMAFDRYLREHGQRRFSKVI